MVSAGRRSFPSTSIQQTEEKALCLNYMLDGRPRTMLKGSHVRGPTWIITQATSRAQLSLEPLGK